MGKTLILNGHDMTVVGVAAAGFDGVQLEFVPQVFAPITMKAQMTPLWDALKDRRWRFVNAFGRLKPGVTLAQAKASLQPFFKSVLEMEVKEPAFRNASVEAREAFLRNVLDVLPGGRGRSYLRRQLETPLLLLMGLTGGVLLIACANVANLLIARAAARDKEIAVRLALGATRRRIVRLLLVDSLVLAVLGAIAGVGMAYATDRMVFGLLPPDTASLKLSPAPDLRILLFTAAVAVVTALVFGLAPALQSTRTDLAPTLKDRAGALAGGTRQARFRKALVPAQVALSLLLLVGAGLFVRSLLNLRRLGPGSPTDRLLAFNLDPSLNAYEVDQSKVFYKQLMEELGALPGVKAVGLASVGILQDNEWDSGVTVEGHVRAPQENTQAYTNSIGPGYFTTLGVPVIAGRDFTLQDTEQIKHRSGDDDWTPRVVIVNEKFERLIAGLSAAFGLLATVLASVGLYGVMAYNVARRTREIGIRIALGAFGGDVVWLVLREALLLVGIGLVVGLPATLALARYARSQLFGVHFADPFTLGLAVLSLGLAAALAGFIPARRASRVDPIRALRYE